MGIRGEVFSSRVLTEKRTYFFNVKENRKGDLFLNVVESTKHGEESFDRHSIIVYQEDIEDFFREFSKAVNRMKKPERSSFRHEERRGRESFREGPGDDNRRRFRELPAEGKQYGSREGSRRYERKNPGEENTYARKSYSRDNEKWKSEVPVKKVIIGRKKKAEDKKPEAE